MKARQKMTKIKKYVLTETGEVRPPLFGDYFIGENEELSRATVDFSSCRYPILELEVIEEEWKPKDGEVFYHFNALMEIICGQFCGGFAPDLEVLRIGNFFRTKEEAESMVEKIKKLLTD